MSESIVSVNMTQQICPLCHYNARGSADNLRRHIMLRCYSIRKIKNNNIPEQDQCCVCFGRIRERYLMFSCGHTRTCFDCLEQIRNMGGNCPLCRTEQIPLQRLFI